MRTIKTIVIFFSIVLFSHNTYSQHSIFDYVYKSTKVKCLEGYSFTLDYFDYKDSETDSAWNKKISLNYKNQPLKIDTTNFIPLEVFYNFYVNVFKKDKKYPKYIWITGEDSYDSTKCNWGGPVYKEDYIDCKDITCPNIYPLFYREISDNIIEFSIVINVPTNVDIELYTFDKSQKRIISNIKLFSAEKYFYEGEISMCHCNILERARGFYYQTIAIEEDGLIKQLVWGDFYDNYRRYFRLRDDGIYEIVYWDYEAKFEHEEIVKFYNAIVQDKNGTANVRRYPNNKSPILYTVKNNENLTIEDYHKTAKKWFKVFNYNNKKFEGWIHKSKIKISSRYILSLPPN